MRVRSGMRYDPETQRWQLVVHLLDRDGGQEYLWAETYASEREAERAYRAQVRPALAQIRAAAERTPGGRVDVHQWGFTPREETPMTRPRETPRRLELELTSLELSMLTQALILMLPQIDHTVNVATGETVTTQSLVQKLLGAGMAANARDRQEDRDART
jgi:hypothetical protein